jgi:hypothetical protein
MKVIKVKQTSIPKLTSKAQEVFNRFIRNRDREKGCISCGSEIDHAGHYLSAGHHGHLRFNEMNVNGQCLRCNNFLHGNLINYRQGLVKRYGEQKVLYLESCAHGTKKWSRCELEAIIQTYK